MTRHQVELVYSDEPSLYGPAGISYTPILVLEADGPDHAYAKAQRIAAAHYARDFRYRDLIEIRCNEVDSRGIMKTRNLITLES